MGAEPYTFPQLLSPRGRLPGRRRGGHIPAARRAQLAQPRREAAPRTGHRQVPHGGVEAHRRCLRPPPLLRDDGRRQRARRRLGELLPRLGERDAPVRLYEGVLRSQRGRRMGLGRRIGIPRQGRSTRTGLGQPRTAEYRRLHAGHTIPPQLQGQPAQRDTYHRPRAGTVVRLPRLQRDSTIQGSLQGRQLRDFPRPAGTGRHGIDGREIPHGQRTAADAVLQI